VAPRVFISSTFTDLAEYRKTVQGAIRKLGAIDVSMENFGARDERPVDECIRLVREESDLFVGIYAHRYGYVPEGAEMSISEMEYKAASDIPLPRFIYMIDDNQPWLPAHMDIGTSRDRLLSFKAALTKRHICQTFKGQDQLATTVVADVGRHIAMRAATKVPPSTAVPVPHIGYTSAHNPVVEAANEWNARRNAIEADHRGVFLTHIIKPSAKPGQTFDVFIYLIRPDDEDLSNISVAEFFLSPYWENKIFPAVLQSGFIGISTSAYGTFLCICRVTFKDGSSLYLDRYIDFEMQRTGGAGA